MKNKKRNIIILIVCIILIACIVIFAVNPMDKPKPDPTPEQAGTGEYRLPIFETSDIHGALIEGYEEPFGYKVAYIADKVNDARRDGDRLDPDKVILLDGGDIYQGNYVSLLSKGEAMSAVYDAMQYDAVTVGNHEFDWGLDTVIDADGTMRDYTLDDKSCINSIPFLCCNIYKDGEKVGFAGDYVILDKTAEDTSGGKKKVRVAVIGMADDYSLSIARKKFLNLGYSIKTDYDEVNKLAQDLEESGQCDAVILLAHGDADKIANALGDATSIDLVLGGHVHKNKNDRTDWGLRYLSPSGNANSYTYDELVFENDGKGGVQIKENADDDAYYYQTTEDENILLDKKENAEELDRKIIDITNEYMDRVGPLLEEKIGYITEPVTKDLIEGSTDRVSSAGNFVCNALIRGANVDVAFMNKSGVRANLYIPKGEDHRNVTLKDLFSMVPFDDIVYIYELTYEDLLNVMEFSMNGGGSGLLSCVTGIDCHFIDDPDDDGGGEYPIRKIKSLVKDGEVIYQDGQWMDGWDRKTLKIAVPEYVATAATNKAGDPNPLYAYNDTNRLISKDQILRDCVVKGLESEAKEKNGHLNVDTQTHFIYE